VVNQRGLKILGNLSFQKLRNKVFIYSKKKQYIVMVPKTL